MGLDSENYIENVLLDLSDEEREVLHKFDASKFFKYIYNSERFQNILNTIDSNDRISDNDWNYIIGRLLLVAGKSSAEADKLDFRDKILRLLCRIGLFFFEDDSKLYNEFYRLFEYLTGIVKYNELNKYLDYSLFFVDKSRNEDLLKILIEQNSAFSDFRQYRSDFSNLFYKNNSDSDLGVVEGSERFNINMMNRSYDATKVLVLKGIECYNTNIDCD